MVGMSCVQVCAWHGCRADWNFTNIFRCQGTQKRTEATRFLLWPTDETKVACAFTTFTKSAAFPAWCLLCRYQCANLLRFLSQNTRENRLHERATSSTWFVFTEASLHFTFFLKCTQDLPNTRKRTKNLQSARTIVVLVDIILWTNSLPPQVDPSCHFSCDPGKQTIILTFHTELHQVGSWAFAAFLPYTTKSCIDRLKTCVPNDAHRRKCARTACSQVPLFESSNGIVFLAQSEKRQAYLFFAASSAYLCVSQISVNQTSKLKESLGALWFTRIPTCLSMAECPNMDTWVSNFKSCFDAVHDWGLCGL